MFCCFVHSSPHFTTALGQVDQVLRLDPRSSSDPAGCCPSQSVCVLPGRGVSYCCVLPSRGVSSCCVLPSRVCVLLLCPSQSGCVLLLCPSQSAVCPLAVSFTVGRTESPRKFTFCPPTAARHSGRESAPAVYIGQHLALPLSGQPGGLSTFCTQSRLKVFVLQKSRLVLKSVSLCNKVLFSLSLSLQTP